MHSINIPMFIVNQLPERLRWLCPVTVPMLTRLGDLMDGGYVVPMSIVEQSSALLSLGLGDNWSFDAAWHQLKPKDTIHMYDGTVSRDNLEITINRPVRNHIDIKGSYDEFFQGPIKHWQENVGPGAGQISLSTCLTRLGSQKIFIKMDIEGGEYALISDLINYRDHITGMVMEFHFCNSHRQHFETAVQLLQEHYSIVHLHANNHVDVGNEGLTDCLELTFVNKSFMPADAKPRTNFYIDGLDFSNVAGVEDYRYCF
jgi:hypothetical protein